MTRVVAVNTDGVRIVDPVGYVEMQGLNQRARGVIMDSGGVRKEALSNGTPCETLRDTTEWTESVAAGVNVLVLVIDSSCSWMPHHDAWGSGRYPSEYWRSSEEAMQASESPR